MWLELWLLFIVYLIVHLMLTNRWYIPNFPSYTYLEDNLWTYYYLKWTWKIDYKNTMDAYSPKSSPRGSVASNSMETGSNPLKLSIALGPGGQKPTIIQKGPFYLMKPDPLPRSDITGATNLMASKGLEHSYVKLTSKFYGILVITWKNISVKIIVVNEYQNT